MKRTLFLMYGVLCYLLFLFTFCYAIGFIGDLVVPKSVDQGAVNQTGPAALINIVLLGIFGLQHSVMARRGFKAWWTAWVPAPIERSTYVLMTCAALNLMYWQWRPMTDVVWQVDHIMAQWILRGLFFAGFGLVLYATILIDHLDLFGLRQVMVYGSGKELTHSPFATPAMYKIVRHPLYLGFIVAFWATPLMTQGHLLFSMVTTAYILVAIQLEERDLVHLFGDDYRRYQNQIPMIIPLLKGRHMQPSHRLDKE